MKAYELIASESQWCDDAFAKDADGNAVHWNSPKAVQFCMQGAIHRSVHDHFSGRDAKDLSHELRNVYTRIYKNLDADKSLPFLNRNWQHEKVLNFLIDLNI